MVSTFASQSIHPSTPDITNWSVPQLDRQVFVGRQPIFDRQKQVIAYELLFRHNERNRAGQLEHFQATARVLLHAFVDLGWEALVNDKQAFVNFGQGFLLQDYIQTLPADRIGIEVLEDVAPDRELLKALDELVELGYTIILDDFYYESYTESLLTRAHIVKLDIQALDRSTLVEQVTRLRPYGVRLLAKKVETLEEFQDCYDLGFDYFQGFFLCRPDVIKGRRCPTSRLTVLQILARLQEPIVEIDEIESLLSQDASLSYRLLRLINASFFGLSRQIHSLREAILLLGVRPLTTWISLMLLAGLDDKPDELLTIALVRAKMCERLAQVTGQGGPDTCLLVGLLSVLDALLDRPMSDLLEELPLTTELTEALLNHTGPLGQLLHTVISYEQGCWEDMDVPELAENEVVIAYLDAINWTTEMRHALEVH